MNWLIEAVEDDFVPRRFDSRTLVFAVEGLHDLLDIERRLRETADRLGLTIVELSALSEISLTVTFSTPAQALRMKLGFDQPTMSSDKS